MIFKAKTIIPVSGPAIDDGIVVVKDDRIVDIGSSTDKFSKYPDEQITDFGNAVIIPGLINLHSHIELEALADIQKQDTFSEWLKEVVARSRELTPDDWLDSARRGARRLLAGGMTAAADISRRGAGALAMAETGIRGVSFHEIVAVDERNFDAAFADLLDRMSLSPERVGMYRGISPHSPYSLSTGSIKKIVDFTRDSKTRLCIHIAETVDEVEMIENGSGPLKDFFGNFIETEIPAAGAGLSPVAYLDTLFALTDSTLAVHCVHINAADARIIEDRGTSVALCPTGNATLGAGVAPIALLAQSGIKFGPGTDSAAGNPHLDLFEDLRAIRDIADKQSNGAVQIPANDLLGMATIGAAEILGLENEIGSLAPGKLADMAVLQPPEDITNITNVVDWATRNNVIATILGGKKTSPQPIPEKIHREKK